MNNGKGSKPRPVKGDVYRKNYERIFSKKKEKPQPKNKHYLQTIPYEI